MTNMSTSIERGAFLW